MSTDTGTEPTTGNPVIARNFILTMTAAAAILTLGACSPPEDGGTYDSLDDLHEAYTGAGLECGKWTPDPEPRHGALESGTCSEGASLFLYEDNRTAVASVTALIPGASQPDPGTPYSLRGVNWVAIDGDLEKLAEATGGELSYRTLPPGPSHPATPPPPAS